MLGLAAAIVFLVGLFVTKAYESTDGVSFWLFIGLILLALHEAFGHLVAARTTRGRF